MNLEVILETALDQTIHQNNFVYAHLLERRLQNFEVLDVEVEKYELEVGLKLDLLQSHGAGKEHVHVLFVRATFTHFLDLKK
jgi:hypothetical protein